MTGYDFSVYGLEYFYFLPAKSDIYCIPMEHNGLDKSPEILYHSNRMVRIYTISCIGIVKTILHIEERYTL